MANNEQTITIPFDLLEQNRYTIHICTSKRLHDKGRKKKKEEEKKLFDLQSVFLHTVKKVLTKRVSDNVQSGQVHGTFGRRQ